MSEYKRRKDIQICKSKALEPTFFEVIQPGKNENIIINCIYDHPYNL